MHATCTRNEGVRVVRQHRTGGGALGMHPG